VLRRDPGSLRAKEVLGRLLYTKATFLPRDSSASGARFTAERLLREVSEADTTMVDALTEARRCIGRSFSAPRTWCFWSPASTSRWGH